MYLSCDLLHGSNCVFVLIRMPKAAIQQGGFHLQIDLLKSLECFFNFGTSHPFPALNMYPKKQTFVQENHDTNPSKHQPSQRAWCLGFDGQCSSFFLWASRTNLRYRFKNLTAWCRKDQKQYRLKRFGQAHGYWAILKLTLREAKPIYIYEHQSTSHRSRKSHGPQKAESRQGTAVKCPRCHRLVLGSGSDRPAQSSKTRDTLMWAHHVSWEALVQQQCPHHVVRWSAGPQCSAGS